jgi:diguanylate cyclase (GGDEF)-like protein/PAS domain S-box-containing protein
MDSDGNFLSKGGEAGLLMRTYDWSQTPLGKPERWPFLLKSNLRLLLSSRFPMFLWWGPSLIQFYNDAYWRRIAPEVHSQALGKSGGFGWSDIWYVLGHEVESIMAGGGATWHEGQRMASFEQGRRRDTWWTYGLCPIEDEHGVHGVLAICNDVTAEYVARENLAQRYRTVTESMNEGFCVLDVLLDENGAPLDCRYVETNLAFEKQSGLKNVTGKTFREIVPEIEDRWAKAYGQVALTGRPVRFAEESPSMGKWFDVYAVRIGMPEDRRVGVLFRDVSLQKGAEHALRQSEERFRLLTQLNPDGILVNVDNRFVYANRAAARMLGASKAEELIGRSPFELIEPEFHHEVRQRIPLALDKRQITQLAEQRWRRLDGSVVTVQTTAAGVSWEGRKGVQVLLRDVTELKQSQERLHIINERLKLAIEGSGEGVWDWDLRSNTTSYSERVSDITGYSMEELSAGPAHWLSRMHPHDRLHVQAAMQSHLEGQAPFYSSEYRIRCKDGDWKWIHSRGVLVERSPDGKPCRVTGLLADITARKEADERVWQLANFDPLTGLPNRRLFRDRLNHEVANAHRRDCSFALLFIDLDRFKQVNDFFGHDAGDTLLVQAAHRIRRCVRDSDTVARLGGDEFTIILGDLYNTDHIEALVQKLLDALALPFAIGPEKAFLSGSIGVAVYPDDARTAEELIRKADQAMYAAKTAGKNQFSYFTREMDEKAHKRLRLLQELRHAVHAGEIQVVYQPVIDLASGCIIKAEALVRWENPLLGTVNPAYFIPIAEEAGMIDVIGDYVFRTAADTAKHWSTTLGMPVQVSVNKSPLQFRSKEQEEWLGYLRQLELSPHHIAIEITEGVLLDISEHVSSKLLEYKDAGIQVAIDDFGTGYSSMAYLQKFAIDYLKIDQSFIRDMATNPGNRSITESMIAMAHKLGLKVIAEGVETEEQMQILKAAGCDYGQGFLFSHALPIREFEGLLRKYNQSPPGAWLH